MVYKYLEKVDPHDLKEEAGARVTLWGISDRISDGPLLFISLPRMFIISSCTAPMRIRSVSYGSSRHGKFEVTTREHAVEHVLSSSLPHVRLKKAKPLRLQYTFMLCIQSVLGWEPFLSPPSLALPAPVVFGRYGRLHGFLVCGLGNWVIDVGPLVFFDTRTRYCTPPVGCCCTTVAAARGRNSITFRLSRWGYPGAFQVETMLIQAMTSPGGNGVTPPRKDKGLDLSP